MGSITKTKAAILVELNQSLEIVTSNCLSCAREVLVKVHSAGCATRNCSRSKEKMHQAHTTLIYWDTKGLESCAMSGKRFERLRRVIMLFFLGSKAAEPMCAPSR